MSVATFSILKKMSNDYMDVSSIGSDRSSTSMSISDSSSVLSADEGVRASDVEARKQATIDTSDASRASDNGIVVDELTVTPSTVISKFVVQFVHKSAYADEHGRYVFNC